MYGFIEFIINIDMNRERGYRSPSSNFQYFSRSDVPPFLDFSSVKTSFFAVHTSNFFSLVHRHSSFYSDILEDLSFYILGGQLSDLRKEGVTLEMFSMY